VNEATDAIAMRGCGYHAQQQIDAFRRTEIRHMRDQKFAIANPKFAPHFFPALRGGIRREEIRDHPDLIAEAERFLGLAAQTFGNGGDGIGMNERMLDRGAVLRVRTEQGGIGPVQGGHDFRRAGAYHFRGEKGRRRMRDGVVDMENIEALRVPHFSHLHRQRQCVVRARKHRRVPHLDLVKMDARAGEIEPDWFGVAEEMDVVSARGQLRPECRRQNPAAADERKTGDPNLE
jgi:hypothetical protein